MSALMTQVEPLIPIAKAAQSIGLSVHCLRRLVATGRVPSVTVAGSIKRVRLSDVRDCVEETVPAHFEDGLAGVSMSDLFQPGVEASPA